MATLVDERPPPLYIQPLYSAEHGNYSSNNSKASPYRTIQRIVTPAPTWLPSLEEDAPPLGELSVSVEEYHPSSSSSSISSSSAASTKPAWRRVAVRSGGSPSSGILIASFELPPSSHSIRKDGTQNSIVCWATFRHNADTDDTDDASTGHAQLCVLASPSLLLVFDVFPIKGGDEDGGAGGEGHSVTLPFEARSIYPMEHGGLLIQRVDTPEDSALLDPRGTLVNDLGSDQFLQGQLTKSEDEYDDHDNHNFVLRSPLPEQPILRIATDDSSLTAGPKSTAWQKSRNQGPQITEDVVPCLFSLSHPLDEIRPVALTPPKEEKLAGFQLAQRHFFSDVFEKIIHVETSSWCNVSCSDNDDGNTNQYSQAVLCVTYHTKRKRHAVWRLDAAPPPPSSIPLWKQATAAHQDGEAEEWDLEGGGDADTITAVFGGNEVASTVHQILEDDGMGRNNLDAMNGMPDVMIGGGIHPIEAAANRNDALAQALGVRGDHSIASNHRNPARGPSLTHFIGRQQSNRRTINPHHPPLRQEEEGVGGEMKDAEELILEDNAAQPDIPAASSTQLPVSELHPSMSMTLLYEDHVPTKDEMDNKQRDVNGQQYQFAAAPAKQSFLVSNVSGSGTLVLCLVCDKVPELQRDGGNNRFLRYFSLKIGPGGSNTKSTIQSTVVSLSSLEMMECIAAQPIQSTPLSPFFRKKRHFGRPNLQRTKEVLVCRKDSNLYDRTTLRLYRSNVWIVDCAVPPPTAAGGSPLIFGLENAAFDKVDLVCAAVGNRPFAASPSWSVVRACIPMECSSSPVAEGALLALESSLLASSHIGSVARDCLSQGLMLHIRADCSRLIQTIPSSVSSNTRKSLSGLHDVGWSAVSTVLSLFFDQDSASKTSPKKSTRTSRDESIDPSHDDSAWEDLLRSEFHRIYTEEHGSNLLLGYEISEEIPSLAQSLDSTDVQATGGFANSDIEDSIDIVHQELLDLLLSLSPSSVATIHNTLDQRSSSEHLHVKGGGFSITSYVIDALHLFYEDSKLIRNSRGNAFLRPLGAFLVRLCVYAGYAFASSGAKTLIMGDFVDHYRRDLGGSFIDDVLAMLKPGRKEDSSALEAKSRRETFTSYPRVPCIFSWIDAKINANNDAELQDLLGNDFYNSRATEEINSACSATQTIHRLFSYLFWDNQVGSHSKTSQHSQQRKDRRLVITMINEGIDDPAILVDELPAGVAIPLMEVLNRCRSDPPTTSSSTNWTPAAYSLIGRPDLAEMEKIGRDHDIDEQSTSRNHNKLTHESTSGNETVGTSAAEIVDADKDGVVPLEHTSSMLFPEDNRIREAGRLLRSSRPSYLRVFRAVEVTDHDYERLKQEKLLLLCRRVLALPLGRGMLTLGNLQPVPAEPMPMPDICLAGRVLPTNGKLALDVSNCASDMTMWPEFHNGVAAGLRLPLAGRGDTSGLGQITRTWIVYNRPAPVAPPPANNNVTNTPPPAPVQNQSHGGFLLALGLRGHLSSLAMTDIYEYLTKGSVTTTVGILLGTAAAKRGTCDPAVSKMLCLHIPSLLPASFAALEVAAPAQAAAVTGIGLLYQGSSHRLMTEFLLNEMGKKPCNDQSTQDREGYTLSCGFALGLVNLTQGAKSTTDNDGGCAGLADLHIEERLHRYVVGGVDDSESRRRREAAEMASGAAGMNGGDNERSSRIFEGDTINTDVTAPGATLALALMFLQTGNKTVASRLGLPDTHFLLDYVRPDLLLFRVLARSMILWNEVHPSSEWIEDQIPLFLRTSFMQMGRRAEKMAGFAGLSVFASLSMDLSQDRSFVQHGTTDGDVTVNEDEQVTSETLDSKDMDFDRQAVRQAHAHIVAGACFGMGLRYAGTGDPKAAAAISERVVEFSKLRDDNDPISLALKPERPIVDMCLACSAIALGMVMAGTGDIETLRLFKSIRWKCDSSVRYGTHMAFGTAIGLLFLGGGTCTLGRSPEDIASLLISFFPRFPTDESDNQYHLQALRHCYALAVKRRDLVAIDVDTREELYLPIQMRPNDEASEYQQFSAPCLLLNTTDVSQTLRVVSDRYYPVTLQLKAPTCVDSRTTIFVKKKTGHLSYVQDPYAQRSLVVQTGGSSTGSALALIKSFTEDPRLLAYAQFLCDSGNTSTNALSSKHADRSFGYGGIGSQFDEFCTDILHECLTQEKQEALPLYLSLYSFVTSITRGTSAVWHIWDVRLIRSYYESREMCSTLQHQKTRLLSVEFVALLCNGIDSFFANMDLDGSQILQYAETFGDWDQLHDELDLIGSFLVWCGLPCQEIPR